MKACRYCAEEIQEAAIVCKHCGKDLTKEPSEDITQKRVQLVQKQAEYEKAIASWERYIQEQTQLAQQAGRQVTWALIGLIVGLFLIPLYGLGLILVIAGIMAAITQSGKRREAERNQAKAYKDIETLQKLIIQLKTELAALQ